jgi:isoleucyl-tRNA synthetase
VESVHLADIPLVDESLVDQALADKWDRLLEVRSAVTKSLETARKEKTIGHPLDAEVKLYAQNDLYGFLKDYEKSLREIFIVSQVELFDGAPPATQGLEPTEVEGLQVLVAQSGSPKCPRCWIRDPRVPINDRGEPTGVCPRCRDALEIMGFA